VLLTYSYLVVKDHNQNDKTKLIIITYNKHVQDRLKQGLSFGRRNYRVFLLKCQEVFKKMEKFVGGLVF